MLRQANVPVVTDAGEAARRPELGVLSAMAHGETDQGATIAAAVVGGVLGLVFGEKEATRLENYRMKVAGEVSKLSHEVDQLKQERQTWQERTQDASPEAQSKPTLA